MSMIKDPSLAGEGLVKIDWVRQHEFMPVLTTIEERYAKERPFEGLRIAISIHLEAKTAYLALVLKAGGADVYATGCNPLSTRDDIAAALDSLGVNVFAEHGADAETYEKHLIAALGCRPHIIVDDGGDFVSLLHGRCPELAENLWGGCEETTTGILRLKQRVREGSLRFPMMAVNDANSKHLFDNRYGTGQSVWDGIMNSTNLLVAGKTVVVAGYGWCGRGIAMRAKGMGAKVIVTEIDPFKALEACMDGYTAMRMDDAAALGDIFVTATGCKRVITARHFEKMKNNAVLANAGHFDVEIDKNDLLALSDSVETRRPFIEGYHMRDGRTLNLLSEGRLVNITAGNGHPADIMDMSFAIQALACRYIAENHDALEPKLYDIPEGLDNSVALIKLAAMGAGIDELDEEQRRYLFG